MYNIIKSLNYNAQRDIVIVLALLTVVVIPVFSVFFMGVLDGTSLDELTGDYYYISQMGENFIIIMFVIMVVVCRICGADASDKTINYEFLTGHKRSSIYFARIIAGMIWGVFLTLLLFYLPLPVFFAINGWEPSLSPGDAVLRLVLAVFPAMRLAAFMMMVTMLLRSAGKGIAVSYMFIMVMVLLVSILQDVAQVDLTWQTAFSNVMILLSFDNSRNVVINGETVAKVESAVSFSLAIGTVVASVIGIAVYVLIAYAVFKKKDRD